MRRYDAAPDAPVFVMGHGAGAGESHPWMIRVAEGLASRGVTVVTFDFPYMAERSKRPDPGPVLERAFAEAWLAAAQHGAARVTKLFAGGKSMGGRISSQAAAKSLLVPEPLGLVFFGYPLHPPKQPAKRRDAHLGNLTMPLLFLHGTRDPFGSETELVELTASLPHATLEIVRGGDHSLATPKRADPEGSALDRALDVASAWMRYRG